MNVDKFFNVMAAVTQDLEVAEKTHNPFAMGIVRGKLMLLHADIGTPAYDYFCDPLSRRLGKLRVRYNLSVELSKATGQTEERCREALALCGGIYDDAMAQLRGEGGEA